jgi:hypothetical protein
MFKKAFAIQQVAAPQHFHREHMKKPKQKQYIMCPLRRHQQ